ncbi:hypothetical protein ACQW02_26035 [Humitalea sp. 24SJ18S-53]|uniref:hypothetical protein n=1 Tax=Humitalea sp. 24SJ18S-53 TaxID=3422307 RepID=UPI003D671976
MRHSIPVLDGGALIAVAAQGDAGWFLIAIDARLEELDRANFPSAPDVERAARAYLRRNHPITAFCWGAADLGQGERVGA